MLKTVLFQTIHINIITLFSSIWPIFRTLSGATRGDLVVIAIKKRSAFPKSLALLEPHFQIVYRHIQNRHWRGLTPLQRSNVCILQPQPTILLRVRVDMRWMAMKGILHNPHISKASILTIRCSFVQFLECPHFVGHGSYPCARDAV